MIDLVTMQIEDIITIVSIIIATGATGTLLYVLTTLKEGLVAMKVYRDCKPDGWTACHCEPACEYGQFGESVVPLVQAIEKLIHNKLVPIVDEKLLKK